jgi:predicted histidine transporter YuiF (NhaC family)
MHENDEAFTTSVVKSVQEILYKSVSFVKSVLETRKRYATIKVAVQNTEEGGSSAMGYIIVGAIALAIGGIYTSWAGEYASIVLNEMDDTDAS